jgi:hypothetical protein
MTDAPALAKRSSNSPSNAPRASRYQDALVIQAKEVYRFIHIRCRIPS